MKQLTFGFRGRPLFQNLSFAVGEHQLVHLAGPNGVGKSTLMAIIAGLVSPNSGSIEFHLSSRGSSDESQDRRLYQEYLPAEANCLFLKMDAMNNLSYWSKLRGKQVSRERLLQVLGRWGLSDPIVCERFAVEKFSTGMKRRLALARLELSDSPLWLLDEPLYGLDQKAIGTFRELLKEHLKNKGMALVVSHDLGAIEGIVTQTVELKK